MAEEKVEISEKEQIEFERALLGAAMTEREALKAEVAGLKIAIRELTNIIEDDRKEFENILNEGYEEAFQMLQAEKERVKDLQDEFDEYKKNSCSK